MTSDLSKACPRAREKNRVLSGQGGMATGTVTLIAFLMTAIAYGILALNSTINVRGLRYLFFQNSVEIIHTNIYAFGQNDAAFQKTLATNNGKGRMWCIRDGDPCPILASSTSFEKVALTYPNGAPYYAVDDPLRNGFRLDGTPCAFNASKVVDGCALQLDIRWTPFCETACVIKPNRLIFYFFYKLPAVSAAAENYLPISTQRKGPMSIIMSPYR